MKLLFLTTLNLAITIEHVFTKNVWGELCNHFKVGEDEIALATIFQQENYGDSKIVVEKYQDKKYYKLFYSSLLSEDKKIAEVTRFFQYISPSIIHSNMVDAIDVYAAKACNLPIVLTIHVGGAICPRGGVHGFMNYKDEICNTSIGSHCIRCCAQDLPFPALSHLLYRTIPDMLLSWAADKVAGKQVFYISQFLNSFKDVTLRKEKIEIYKYATIIAANPRLKQLLALNGLTDNVVLLPHGVQSRPCLPLPQIEGVVKFFYVGRIQYAKGIHNMLKAFDGIDTSSYELHIIGDSSDSPRGKKYKAQLIQLAKGKNVIFHGEIPNNELESIVKDMHVMIHPAIFLEVYGITIAESLSMGRPVLATRCGGAEMQIVDEEDGWLVSPNNINELHNKIVEVIQNNEQVVSMSENCRIPHSLYQYAYRLKRVYKSILKAF